MSTEPDFKTLWSKRASNKKTDTANLIQKAAKVRKAFRFKMMVQIIGLTASIVVMLKAGLSIHNREYTTNIGLALMIIGVVAYLITNNRLLPMLFKREIGSSSQEYINQLIRIQRKNEFMHKVMIDVYFCLLTVGLWLYLLQGAKSFIAINAALLYLVPSGFLAIAWVFAKRRELKTIRQLGDTIEKLESLNGQLVDDDIHNA
ncbi:hypothetical protein [Mucilaginibacter agri]|uniref:Uncharacterized protein n=1 Tax=Mucilaginibacter agri TaxID=2695265 RepID=A0A965ZMN9_9SPHI|nr:hypothetical protein [Mucilaginibacter agri]NCD72526.1 hypothetical protein [Mucilaginibacter agri]